MVRALFSLALLALSLSSGDGFINHTPLLRAEVPKSRSTTKATGALGIRLSGDDILLPGPGRPPALTALPAQKEVAKRRRCAFLRQDSRSLKRWHPSTYFAVQMLR